MTPSATSTMTDGQIDKAVANFRTLLEKHRNEFASDPTQRALGNPALHREQLGVLRKHIEAESNTIVRVVKVFRMRTPQAILDATGRTQYTDKEVVATMPKGEGDEAEVHFFKLSRFVSVDDLDREYESRNLKPDPYAQSQVNADDPSFADEHPNGSQWRDQNGKACCATFDHWLDERRVHVYRYDRDWDDSWWFAGVRK
ncbi:MAG: hypothetical protein UT78_C0007G0057 [Candidatus Nomurabacteria bacterium GW2011_GWF2_40_12]|uniref:Uncharacterized protein n=1 Tax=Candidatus Nomurabacteria bacterium GW2011_GWF2_40_12 TaxID=1618776 RepID=A0A0G0QS00_9BACT|nr:MAG: hypothetical protein UT78_C0007G0057 [Candidatus Nomurabacteria bacterium GW2011_GWF2_40_12]